MHEITPNAAEAKPGTASAESGVVILDGPDGVAVTLTVEAAEATGRSLIAAAEQAAAQRSGQND